MKAADFIKQALEHYSTKLKEETERFGVLGCMDAFIENNSTRVVREEDAGQIWKAISEQSGMHLHVDYCPGNPQCVFGVLSKEVIPHPGHFYELWCLVEMLKGDEDEGEKIESLYLYADYDGPYKLDVPDSVYEG